MSELASTQRLMWAAITWPTGVQDFLAKSNDETKRRFAETFGGTDAFGAVERVDVYANAYFGRLAGVLGDAFEVTRWLVGDVDFHNLCTDYVLHRPSVDPDLRHFGARFPGFLAEHELALKCPAAVDMATVEWARVNLLDAEDVEPMPLTELLRLAPARWPTLRLRPSGALTLLRTRWPCTAIWQAHRQDLEREAYELPDTARPGWTLVWRTGFSVAHRPLDPSEGRALQALLQGQTFEGLCDAAAGPERQGAQPDQVAGFLRAWIDDGLIAGLQAC